MNTETFKKMQAHIPTHLPQIRAVAVLSNGKTVFEARFNQEPASTLYPLLSMTKSVLSALVGIALQKGVLKSLDQKLVDFFPEYVTPRTSQTTRQISLKHLLSMTSGFDLTGVGDTSNYFQLAMQLTVTYPPGAHFSYSDLDPHLVSGILSKAAHKSALDFADEHLFRPLGIAHPTWEADPLGFSVGSSDLSLSLQDMGKLAALYLQNGQWNGKQIVPAEWVKRSTQAQSEGGWPYFCKYGYLWWVIDRPDLSAYFAGGYGGQFIFNAPILKMSAVITSEPSQPFIQENFQVIQEYILPAFQGK